MDPAAAMLADPERALGPSQSRIPAMSGRRYCGDHLAGPGIDLTDHGIRDLEQVLAVECGPRMSGDDKRSRNFSAFGIKGIQPLPGCEPDLVAVEADSRHVVDIGKGTIFTDDFGG